jgi:hypothetical protein
VRDFDQSCEDSSDCRPVRDGDQCVCGLCPTAAINNAAVSAWEAASEAMDCPRIDCNHSIICEPKAYGCRDNRCVVVNAPNIDATPSSDPGPRTTQYAIDYDQRCEVASDCRVVTEGLKCCMGCAQYGAISNGAFSTWESDLTLIECPGDPLFPCAGAPTKPGGCSRVEPIVTCVSGRCEVGAE